MAQKYASLALQLVTVLLLVVVAFELAQQPKAVDPTASINNVSSNVQALDQDVQDISGAISAMQADLQLICAQVVPTPQVYPMAGCQ